MKSSFAALTALLIAAIAFFSLNPANAAMAALSSTDEPPPAFELLHQTGGKESREMLADGLAYGLSVASQFTASSNFNDYEAKSREFYRAKGCPIGTRKNAETGNCFWKKDNGRYIYGE